MNTQLDQFQQKSVEALCELKRICERHGIRFYLLAGSALGAVRHGGMIPWDDDVDVGLLHDDWYRLREILPAELGGGFRYVDDAVEDGWPRLFGKILYERRSCVDIFLIAKWTKNPVSGYFHWFCRNIARSFYSVSINYSTPFRTRPEWSGARRAFARVKYFIKTKLLLPVRGLVSRDLCLGVLRRNERSFEEKDTGWYINLYSVYSMKKEMIKAEWVESPSTVAYEGEQYLTMGDTDAYLTHLYGDYMTLPPVEQRVRLHSEVF